MSTNSTKQAKVIFFIVPQFDFTTLFSVTASVGLCWAIYYSFFSINLLSDIVILTKFRNKLLEQGAKSFLNEVSIPGLFLYKILVKSIKN